MAYIKFTNSQGRANFTHTVPLDQPLGLITISIMYNGTTDLLQSQRNLSTVTIRSTTVMVVDPITDNPVAGESFVVTGSISSDNGSALQMRNGDPLTANVLFRINGDASGFTSLMVKSKPMVHGQQLLHYLLDLLREHILLRQNIYHQ